MLFRNLSANMVAALAGPLVSIAFTPFYLKRLGDDGFGAVGFFAVLAVVVQLFAQGINMTLERRAASKLRLPSERQSVQILYGTLQFTYWAAAAVVFVIIAALSGALADYWEAGNNLEGDARLSIVTGGLLIGLNLIIGLYSSLFIGLGRQVFLSTVQIAAISAQTLISVGLIVWKPAPSSFIIGQVVSAAGAAFVLGREADRAVGWRESGLRADWKCLKAEARLSLGLIGVEALGGIITHIDRMLVIIFLPPISNLTPYTVAQTGARGLGILRGPLLQTFTPIILSWAALEEFTAIRKKFWKIQTILMSLVGVLATVIALTSKPIISLWVGSESKAEAAGPLMSLLVVGSFLLVMSGPPYLVAVSRKYTRGVLIYNAVSVILMACAGPWCVKQFGLIGAASVWLAYCAGSLIVTHAGIARLLYSEALPEFIRDAASMAGRSLVVVGVICGLYYLMMFLPGTWLRSVSAGVLVEIGVLVSAGFFAAYGLLLKFNSAKNLARYVSE